MFNYRDNQFLKSCILLVIILLWGISLGYIWGSRDLRETVVEMSIAYNEKMDEKGKEHVEEIADLTRSHRNSMSRLTARLDNIIRRIEGAENETK